MPNYDIKFALFSNFIRNNTLRQRLLFKEEDIFHFMIVTFSIQILSSGELWHFIEHLVTSSWHLKYPLPICTPLNVFLSCDNVWFKLEYDEKVAVCSNSKCGKTSVMHKIIQWTVENIRAIHALKLFLRTTKKVPETSRHS